MIKLRGIQEEALDGAISSFRSGGTYHLLQAPVAFGKTIFSSALMKHAVDEFGAKCLFLAHLTELVVQTVDKFNAVAPELSCGVVMGNQKKVCDVTVGTRQTVGKNLDLFEKINLIIIDEVHLYGPQYQKIVDHFLEKNPRLRVVGVTGTPFNLKEGWIYGDKKIWPDPFHASTMDQMIDMGYLSPYRYKMAESLDDELQGIKKTAGEFNEGDLGEMMQEEHHMGTVKHAIEAYAYDRKRIMVFAVTIEHAEKLADFLGCFAVHSKLKKDDWREKVDRFKSGDERILVNVSQLSIGFDCPEVDCVVVARPTMSPALHVQIFGRGMRISEGKKDCLFLDLVGNYLRHGLPSNPKVRNPKEKQDDRESEDAKSKVCPECFEVVEGEETVCPHCGAELTVKKDIINRDEAIKMMEIERENNAHRFIKWWEKDAISNSGYHGVRFCLSVTNREKPVFKFVTNGAAKQEKVRIRLREFNHGDIVNIIDTAYGPWVS